MCRSVLPAGNTEGLISRSEVNSFERKEMFQRYTEKARRVIFFTRYEACDDGSPFIETEHLLLELVRQLAGESPVPT
jgi:ATP-dependent Clp protease ATP-binding subunit ClpC